VYLFVVYCFEVQMVEMASGSAASSSDSVGGRRSLKVKNRWYGEYTIRGSSNLVATDLVQLVAPT
jgi:hypothetical protein